MADQLWRLNNLYWIVNQNGKKVRFRLKEGLLALFLTMANRNIVLKDRQYGFTTGIDIYILDCCLFYENIAAAIIAHNKDDAAKFLANKILYPYNQLPDALKDRKPIEASNTRSIKFANGSEVSAATSARSGTVQILHVSEMGKIAAKYPAKAKEIITGSFEAVATDSRIFVESTAEGQGGEFHNLVDVATKDAAAKRVATPLTFKIHFHAWWENGRYRIDPTGVPIEKRMQKYFADLDSLGIHLDAGQKAWYVEKERILGELMWREYPSHEGEPFKVAIDGAYFAHEMRLMREEGRITRIAPVDGAPVDTWWDLGVNDANTIWFTQTIGREIRAIDYYENSDVGLDHYTELLHKKRADFGWNYGRHVGPHDIVNRDYSAKGAKKRIEVAQELGITFDVAPRISSEADGIAAMRTFLKFMVIDQENCDRGIECLDSFRKEWNAHLGTWKDTYLHNWASHGAKAFQTLSIAHGSFVKSAPTAKAVRTSASRGWT